MCICKEGGFPISETVTHDLTNAAGDESEPTATEGSSCIFADKLESDQSCHDSSSAESDSDDEVELYMQCLRAVHAGPQPQKEGFNAGKRPSVSKSKMLSTPMPSISESLDEEPNVSCIQDYQEDMETAVIQAAAPALQASHGKENSHVLRWTETFSCSSVSKTLVCTALLVLFLVVSYHYDFLACLGLYLISVIWLCCQGERHPVKNNNRLS